MCTSCKNESVSTSHKTLVTSFGSCLKNIVCKWQCCLHVFSARNVGCRHFVSKLLYLISSRLIQLPSCTTKQTLRRTWVFIYLFTISTQIDPPYIKTNLNGCAGLSGDSVHRAPSDDQFKTYYFRLLALGPHAIYVIYRPSSRRIHSLVWIAY